MFQRLRSLLLAAARRGLPAALLPALLLLAAACADRPPAPAPQQPAQAPIEETTLQGFPQQNSDKPQETLADVVLQTQTCTRMSDHPDLDLLQLQDLLHQQGLDQLLFQRLNEPWIQKHLSAQGTPTASVGQDMRDRLYNCLRVQNERYINGKNLGELCVQMHGGLVETCDELLHWQALRTICLKQKGGTADSLKKAAMTRALRDIVAKNVTGLQNADADLLQQLAAKATVVQERFDKDADTYCLLLRVDYTPVAAAVYMARKTHAAEVQRQKKAAIPDYTTRSYFLALDAYPLGTLLPVYGEGLAVTQDAGNARILGLNGLREGQAQITRMALKDTTTAPTPAKGGQDAAGADAAATATSTAGPSSSGQSSPEKTTSGQQASDTAPSDQSASATHASGTDTSGTNTAGGSPGDSSSQTPDQTPGQASDQASGQASGQTQDQASGQISSSTPEAAATPAPPPADQSPDQPAGQASQASPSQTSDKAQSDQADQSGTSSQSDAGATAPAQAGQSAQEPRSALHPEVLSKKPAPPEFVTLADQDIRDFVLTLRISRDFTPPDKGESKVIPLVQLVYFDWIRDDLGLQLQKGAAGGPEYRVHFLDAASNYASFLKPTGPHTWRIERENGVCRLYLDDQLIKSGVSQGRNLVQITIPITWKTGLYELTLEQRIPRSQAQPAAGGAKASGGSSGKAGAGSSGAGPSGSDTQMRQDAEDAVEMTPGQSIRDLAQDPDDQSSSSSLMPSIP